MNVREWITRFERNLEEEVLDWSAPVTLDPETREAVVGSLAIFQLGESGEGSTLFRYAERVALRPGFEDYPVALRLFVEEEHRHARMLKGLVERLEGHLLEKQWSNGVFRWVRKLINLEFQVQVLLTAELMAEAYYDLLRRKVDDPVVHQACRRILKDEIGHLAFHGTFFRSWMTEWSFPARALWRLQFLLITYATQWVVWWDHGKCFRALKIKRCEFFARVRRARRTFLRRVFSGHSSPVLSPGNCPEGKSAH